MIGFPKVTRETEGSPCHNTGEARVSQVNVGNPGCYRWCAPGQQAEPEQARSTLLIPFLYRAVAGTITRKKRVSLRGTLTA